MHEPTKIKRREDALRRQAAHLDGELNEGNHAEDERYLAAEPTSD